MTDSAVVSEVAKREEETLVFWEREHIFKKTLEKEAPRGDFAFYEGPPTANGKPGIHHLESRAFKDAVPRYKTMQGYRVPRQAGWDTHGLPVELEVEKQLGLTHKKQIEEYGIAAFNRKCRESVFNYIDEWKRFTRRIGYWVDQAKAYFTFDASYMETEWGIFKTAARDGRLYKDYKVLPWCPRDETALSSHELAQGYEEVKDLTVTAKFERADEPGTYFLAWTTTPWTLPGNVALAVGLDIDYVKVKAGAVMLILAKARAGDVLKDVPYEVVETMKGKQLEGVSYKPLYSFAKECAPEAEKQKFEKAFKVYGADFVTTEDGTGIVHTAVMYGQEDFDLGTRIGLPKVHVVNPQGKFVEGAAFLAGKPVVEEETAVDIVKDLAARNLLFSKAKYEHTYPFCWRCKTRLIYYARDSWYIRMEDLREKLVAENARVNWIPEYIREGRMGEWLANAKDWAISRERYWGTPLPIWRNTDGSEQVVIGSIDELRRRIKKSGNRYVVMRHGEADQNVGDHKVSSDPTAPDHLTARGVAQVKETAHLLKNKSIDRIVVSPFVRTRETAKLIQEELALTDDRIIFDARIQEPNLGTYQGKSYREYENDFPYTFSNFSRAPEGGESFAMVHERVGTFMYDLDSRFSGETILIVSHGYPIWLLYAVTQGLTPLQSLQMMDDHIFQTSEMRELPFLPLPHNEKYELDLHRPYIDDVVLIADSGAPLQRVPDVMDVWFDSGSMPFATNSPYPADYIAEAIDQTRGWFYTLLAVGTLQGQRKAYRNVICLGHLLDEDGQKMSKSKGNVVEPFAELERWGADALRFWMYYVNQPGDSKNYDEKTVKDAAKVLGWFENSAKFYELFKTEAKREERAHVLDHWMRARLALAVGRTTDAMEAYDLYSATREIAKLGEDLSQWYVRRIRDRAREGDAAALRTLGATLYTSAKLLAPFAPFLAERIHQGVRRQGDPISVHLTSWPEKEHSLLGQLGLSTKPADEAALIADMEIVRALASEALRLRQKADIKVRQPLSQLSVVDDLSPELCRLLAEEVNVKRIETNAKAFTLATALTPELIREGDERAMARAVAEARKFSGLSVKDAARAVVAPDGAFSAELSTGSVRFNLVRNAA